MDKEIENVLALPIREKYEYFIKNVVALEEIWGLAAEEGFASVGDEEQMMLPLWPKKKFSDLNIAEEWIDYKSEAIDIDDFIYEWIPNLKAENSGICLFWLNNERIHVEIDAFERDLKRELEKY